MKPGLPPPAWHPDPTYPDVMWRWWDGQRWTDHTAPRVPPPVEKADRQPTAEVVVPATIEPAVSASPAERVQSPATRQRAQVSGVLDGELTVQDLAKRLKVEPLRSPLDEQVEVAGETYHAKGIKRVFRDSGMPVTEKGVTLEDLTCALVPEPWNEHDANAVAVLIGEHHVGYIPAELARFYASALADLASKGLLLSGVARVWAKSNGGVIWARVTLLIPEADAL